ncbi:NUC173-domain-containing protein [Pleomassaria siparia CBS 279.74]|uniref:NUC173-domain-containing protein n=1 Tax=Pleomassaria siparia CBS 279.74 TaxID=1314801 RepID=A0A6G1K7F6_9PLEO|nr:NUC173-domain-containing protein [Pleomassaria siparia CBS 279.74]
MSLEERLTKIRDSPKLQSVAQTAVVLSAIEDTLRQQNSEFTPTAYFAALLALLGRQVTSQGIANKDTATAVIYLLDLVTPHVPAPLLRSKFSEILTSLAPALIHPDAEAPLLRSSIGCLESLLVVQDAKAWELPQTQIGPRRAVAGLLQIAIDHRPKVRKRAQEAMAKVLAHPPPSPSLDHPAADMCAATALTMLKDIAETASKAKKSKANKEGQSNEPGLIHALQLIKTVASASGGWPSRKIEELCELLLNISRSSSEYLTMAAFEIFEVIFAGMTDEVSSAKLPRLLEILSDLKPSKNDSQLLPPWIAVISRGYEVSAQIEPEDTFLKLPELFSMISGFLTSPSHNIRISASECLISFLANLIPDSVILEPSVYDEKTLEKIAKIAVDLLSVKYQAAWIEVFNMLCSMFETLRWRSDPILRPVVRIVGELRSNESFSGKKEADALLSSAIGAMGPDVVLEILPLNLPRPPPGKAGRVWLLPILRDSVHNTKLAHFKSEMVPLSEVLFQKVIDHGDKEKTMEVKVFETVVQQIWSILPGYCDLPTDITTAFNQGFAEMLANLLYGQADLRNDICRGLQHLVDSNKAIVELEGEEEDLIAQARISKADARKNLDHLAGFASNMLAVLFNVYSQTLPQYRGTILKTINAYLSIVPHKELMETFERVATSLDSSLAESGSQTQADKQKQEKSQNKMPPMSHTLMDLVITISAYLPRESFPSLFQMANIMINKEDDPQLQKKAYKLIPRLAESDIGKAALQERSVELQQLILQSADKASAPSRRDRLTAISRIIEHMPESELHFIPSVLSEVVISAKEVNEKAREAAYSLLVAMGEKMAAGGVVVQSKVPEMPADAPSVNATLDEYFTMVSAGLAATTPHMISASITAVTRILYEFHARVSTETIQNLLDLMDMFLQNPNREIVQSVLGFVKVEVISLSDILIKPRLNTLLTNLMVWSHEHKAHFKAKVKHIVERMVRKFGVEEVERACPVEDRKLITNIRKTREARKKKKLAAEEDGEEGPKEKPKGKFESEYDQAVYGSESEDSADDNSEDEFVKNQSQKATGKSGKGGQTYIIEDEDEPLDLLSKNALGNISSTKPLRQRKVPQKMTAAKRDVESGKLLLGSDSEDERSQSKSKSKKSKARNDDDGDVLMDVDAVGENESLEAGINAYVDAIRGRDAAQRGQKGKLKFSNKRNQEGDDDMDVDSDDGAGKKTVRHERSGSGSGMGRGGFGRGGSRGRGGDSRGGGRGGFSTQRRGLGVQKTRGGRVDKNRSPRGRGGKTW